MRPRRSNYSSGEIEVLVEEYEALREKRDTSRRGLGYLCYLADLDRAVARLTQKQREAVVLHGKIGLSYAECGRRLGISGSSVASRYTHALERLTLLMNGGP